jgi:hypothetical protein
LQPAWPAPGSASPSSPGDPRCGGSRRDAQPRHGGFAIPKVTRVEPRLRHRGFVVAQVGGFRVHEPALGEITVARGVGDGHVKPALRLAFPRRCYQDALFRALQRETRRPQARLEIHRIDLSEQLPGLHRVAVSDVQAQHASGLRGPDGIG